MMGQKLCLMLSLLESGTSKEKTILQDQVPQLQNALNKQCVLFYL